ncbi:MAG: GNAT family N-acetyltransferase [Planctomycetota bacterium]|nr:GNAT family N-acetyltransferase [Planctomycetota bacterium]
MLSLQEFERSLDSDKLRHPSQLFLYNQLAVEHDRLTRGSGDPSGRFYGCRDADGLDCIAFFSSTRSLVLGPGSAESGTAFRRIALGKERGFRILIGPPEPTTALLEGLGSKARIDLDRSQPFLCTEAPLVEPIEARLATLQDTAWLVRASLQLNEEDLLISAKTVDLELLRTRIEQRIGESRTWLVDAGGRPAAKLEIGNEGPAGALIEGVFTEPSHRSTGLARRLVAEVSRRLLQESPRVGLHVGRSNEPAIRAYRAAGFVEVADLRLALLLWK